MPVLPLGHQGLQVPLGSPPSSPLHGLFPISQLVAQVPEPLRLSSQPLWDTALPISRPRTSLTHQQVSTNYKTTQPQQPTILAHGPAMNGLNQPWDLPPIQDPLAATWARDQPHLLWAHSSLPCRNRRTLAIHTGGTTRASTFGVLRECAAGSCRTTTA